MCLKDTFSMSWFSLHLTGSMQEISMDGTGREKSLFLNVNDTAAVSLVAVLRSMFFTRVHLLLVTIISDTACSQ